MFEMIIFAVTLVVAQTLASFAVMALCMSKWFTKKVYKKTFEMMNNVEEFIETLDKN